MPTVKKSGNLPYHPKSHGQATAKEPRLRTHLLVAQKQMKAFCSNSDKYRSNKFTVFGSFKIFMYWSLLIAHNFQHARELETQIIGYKEITSSSHGRIPVQGVHQLQTAFSCQHVALKWTPFETHSLEGTFFCTKNTLIRETASRFLSL